MNTHSPEYKAWLMSLTEGDEVAYDFSPSYYRTQNWKLDRITKITATGMIRVAGGSLFKNDGVLRGDFYAYLQPVTDTIRETVKRERLIGRMSKTKWSDLPTEVLEKMETLLLFGDEDTLSRTGPDLIIDENLNLSLAPPESEE